MSRRHRRGPTDRSATVNSGGATPPPAPGPEGYVRSGTAIGAAIVCLIVGLAGGSLIGRGGVGFNSSNQAATAATTAGTAAEPLLQNNSVWTTPTDALAEAARTNPGSAAAWTTLGNAYFDSNQYQAAIDAYTRSLQIDPRNADVLTDMGIMYRKIGQPQKAIESFDRAIQANPRHENSLFNKGIVLMHDLQDIPGARRAWEALQKLHPGFVTTSGQTIETLLKNLG